MKKHIQTVIILITMVIIMNFNTVSAKQTSITYTGKGEQQYELSVPPLMEPGQTAEIKLAGTWDTTKRIVVSTDDIIKMTNSIDGKQKDLEIKFEGISRIGDNTAPIEEIANITTGELEGALLGTWTGQIVYKVVVE